MKFVACCDRHGLSESEEKQRASIFCSPFLCAPATQDELHCLSLTHLRINKRGQLTHEQAQQLLEVILGWAARRVSTQKARRARTFFACLSAASLSPKGEPFTFSLNAEWLSKLPVIILLLGGCFLFLKTDGFLPPGGRDNYYLTCLAYL